MDAPDFDHLTRAISIRIQRRRLAGLLGMGAAGLGAIGLSDSAEAKKNKNKKKKKKVKRNDFDCVDVGKFCKNNGQCCSGICQGKKDKKKCKAHDESTCQAGQDFCLGVEVSCTTTTGSTGSCAITTGKASYCFEDGDCFPCSKDSDCVPLLGAGAACIVCTGECLGENPQSTACVSTSPVMI